MPMSAGLHQLEGTIVQVGLMPKRHSYETHRRSLDCSPCQKFTTDLNQLTQQGTRALIAPDKVRCVGSGPFTSNSRAIRVVPLAKYIAGYWSISDK